MRSRHQVDTSMRFNAGDPQPDTRQIEDAGLAHIPARDPETVTVAKEPYIAGAGLTEAVNLAIALGRPLLLQGDPGTGKTRLAHAVAYALGLPLEEAYIKSTSRAQELLYSYDAVRRLYDAQVSPDPPTASDYIRLGPLGRAIVRARYGRRSVVLIDEIDKADIDYPNDLLRELDQLTFEIAELPGRRFAVPAGHPELRPVVIVTNNEEKTLPTAFLRRCVFHHIEFPSDGEPLDAILALHGIDDMELRAEAIDVLLELRSLDLSKKPGLSELLDWVGYLHAVEVPPEKVGELPYLGALIKQRADELRVREQLASR
jgi:MoxR-like ATPase